MEWRRAPSIRGSAFDYMLCLLIACAFTERDLTWLLALALERAFVAAAFGATTVVPSATGKDVASVGRLCARTWVTASKPEASLISVGSLNALAKKLMPKGRPSTVPTGTCTMG